MNIKLTLSIEQNVIEAAKMYAKENNLSLSSIVENLLKLTINTKEKSGEIEIPPIVKSLKGKYKGSEVLDYNKELSDILFDKYINDKSNN